MAVTSGGGWVATGGESPVKSTTAEAPPRRRRAGVRVVDIVVEGSSCHLWEVLGESSRGTSISQVETTSHPRRRPDFERSQTNEVPVYATERSRKTQRFLLRVVHVSAPFVWDGGMLASHSYK